MRQILNISLPAQMATLVKQELKNGEYASTSEFFRCLLRGWMEERALIELNKGRKEIILGRAKKLRSLKDLR